MLLTGEAQNTLTLDLDLCAQYSRNMLLILQTLYDVLQTEYRSWIVIFGNISLCQHLGETPITPRLTVILVQHTVAMINCEVNILNSVAVVISHSRSACEVFWDTVFARDSRVAGRVVKWHHDIKHTMGSNRHAGPVNMAESRLLCGDKNGTVESTMFIRLLLAVNVSKQSHPHLSSARQSERSRECYQKDHAK